VQQNQALPRHSVMPGRGKPGHDKKWIHFQDATQALKLLAAFSVGL
jgi:hypothetical protein